MLTLKQGFFSVVGKISSSEKTQIGQLSSSELTDC